MIDEKEIPEDLRPIAEMQSFLRQSLFKLFELTMEGYLKEGIKPHMIILNFSGILSETTGRLSSYFTDEEQKYLRDFLEKQFERGMSGESVVQEKMKSIQETIGQNAKESYLETAEMKTEEEQDKWLKMLKTTKPLGNA